MVRLGREEGRMEKGEAQGEREEGKNPRGGAGERIGLNGASGCVLHRLPITMRLAPNSKRPKADLASSAVSLLAGVDPDHTWSILDPLCQ